MQSKRGIVLKNLFPLLTDQTQEDTWHHWTLIADGFLSDDLTATDIPQALVIKEPLLKDLLNSPDANKTRLAIYFMNRAIKLSQNSAFKRQMAVELWMKVKKLITSEVISNQTIFDILREHAGNMIKFKKPPKEDTEKKAIVLCLSIKFSSNFISASQKIQNDVNKSFLSEAWRLMSFAYSKRIAPTNQNPVDAEWSALIKALEFDPTDAATWFQIGMCKRSNSKCMFPDHIQNSTILNTLPLQSQAMSCFVQAFNFLKENGKDLEKQLCVLICDWLTDNANVIANLPVKLYEFEINEDNKQDLLCIVNSRHLVLSPNEPMHWHNLAASLLMKEIDKPCFDDSFLKANSLSNESSENVLMYCLLKQYTLKFRLTESLSQLAAFAIDGGKFDWDPTHFPLLTKIREWYKKTPESFFLYCHLERCQLISRSDKKIDNKILEMINDIRAIIATRPDFWQHVDMTMLRTGLEALKPAVSSRLLREMPDVARLNLALETATANISTHSKPVDEKKLTTDIDIFIKSTKSFKSCAEINLVVHRLLAHILVTVPNMGLRDSLCLKVLIETGCMPYVNTDRQISLYTCNPYPSLFHLLSSVSANNTFDYLFTYDNFIESLKPDYIQTLLGLRQPNGKSIKQIAEDNCNESILKWVGFFSPVNEIVLEDPVCQQIPTPNPP